MLIYIKGNMFETPAQVLVNTVNTVGVMGKGIALTFKKIYPDMYNQYRKFCESKDLTIGKLFLYKTPGKWILNFPTKENWRNPSELKYIEAGLKKFVTTYKEKEIRSIAFPKLGCGNGGLDFDTQVKPLIDKYLSTLEIDIYVYLEDIDTIQEHNNILNMKKWLDSNIQNISAIEFQNDLVDYSKGIADLTIGEEQLNFEEQSLPYTQILSFWDYIRNNNISLQKEVLKKYFSDLSNENFNKLLKILNKIGYINVNDNDLYGSPLIIYQPFKKIDSLYL